MPDPLQFTQIQHDTFDAGTPKELDLQVGGRKLIYGRGVRARIEVPKELEIEPKTLAADVLAALRLSEDSGEDTRFVTLSSDHALMLWTVHGTLIRRLDRPAHKKAILGLWELSGRRLACWGAEQKLFIWDTGDARGGSTISARARSAEHVLFAPSGNAVCITGFLWSTRIVRLRPQPRQQTWLWWQSDPLTAVRELRGAYITVAKSGTKLRAANGKLLTALPAFSLKEGLYEFPKEHPHYAHFLQIIDDQQALLLLDPSGAPRGVRAADEALAKQLGLYFKNYAPALKAIEAATLDQLGYRDNPTVSVAATQDDARKPPKDVTEEQKQLWHFFHRPRNARIQSWLLAEIQAARDVDRSVRSAIRVH